MGKLYVVGIGCGEYENMTIRADKILKMSDIIYCDEMIFEKIKKYYDNKKIISNKYTATSERCDNAIKSAIINNNVSIVGSGDTGIYGISSIILNKIKMFQPDLEVEIIPGVTSALSGAAILGSPLTQDFAVLTLSDKLADSNMRDRIINAARTDFCIVFYSPCNSDVSNLKFAKETLLKYRSPDTIIGVVSDIGSDAQKFVITKLSELNLKEVQSNTTIFVGRKDTETIKNKKMITPLYNFI